MIVKTPFSYYGGKQNMASKILNLLPEHNLYCEPFCGGAAIFWAKQPSNVEVLNDTNQELQLENTDAIRIINSRDTKDGFFYCDPPYYNSDMGHYDGYTIEDFEGLLKTLEKIEGKFLLSSYPSDILSKYTKSNNWNQRSFDMTVSVNAKGEGARKKKTEVLTANYELKAAD